MAENLLPRGDDLAQQENNGFGPLFKRRGKTATVSSVIMVVISGATLFFAVKDKEKEFHFLMFTAALLTLSFVFGELLRRLSLLFEEIKHKRTRYQGNWKGNFVLVPWVRLMYNAHRSLARLKPHCDSHSIEVTSFTFISII